MGSGVDVIDIVVASRGTDRRGAVRVCLHLLGAQRRVRWGTGGSEVGGGQDCQSTANNSRRAGTKRRRVRLHLRLRLRLLRQ